MKKINLSQSPEDIRRIEKIVTLTMIVLTAISWNTIWLYPLKMLSVFFHEFSHAFATVLTGGDVIGFELSPREGGVVTHLGGFGFLISTAGYLGSLLWGTVLFLCADRTRYDRYVIGFLPFPMVVTLLFFSPNFYAFLFCCFMGLLFGIIAYKGSKLLNDLSLRVTGITVMLYAPLDIISDTISRSYLQSDARNLAENYFGTTLMWGVLWLLVSVVVIVWVLVHMWKRKV